MNDINKADANIADIESVENEAIQDIDLDELYSEVELDNVDDIGGLDSDNVALTPVAAPKNSKEKLWLMLTFLFLIFAVLSSFIFPPAVSMQKQRIEQVAEIIDKVNLTNISATQALSANGRFDGVKNNLADTQISVDKLVSPRSGFAGIASKLFNNAEANASIESVWNLSLIHI